MSSIQFVFPNCIFFWDEIQIVSTLHMQLPIPQSKGCIGGGYLMFEFYEIIFNGLIYCYQKKNLTKETVSLFTTSQNSGEKYEDT